MPDQPEPFLYRDTDGYLLRVEPSTYREPNTAFLITHPDGVQVPAADVEKVIAALRDSAGQPAPAVRTATGQPCGHQKPHPNHTFMRMEVLFQCPGVAAGQPVPTVSGDLRQHLVDAIRTAAYSCDGECDLDEVECAAANPVQVAGWTHGEVSDVQAPIVALADAVLPVVRAAETAARVAALNEAAEPPLYIWQVWREDQPLHAYYATEEDALQGSVECWEEAEPICPEYSWAPDGLRMELVAGGEQTGVYISRQGVHGRSQAAARVAALTEAAAVYREVAERLAADAEQGAKEGFTRIYRRSAAQQVREWAAEIAARAEAQTATVIVPVGGEQH